MKIVQLDVLAGGGSNGEKKSFLTLQRDNERQTDRLISKPFSEPNEAEELVHPCIETLLESEDSGF